MLFQEIRHAARRLWRAPLLSGTVICLMACGVAASTSLFSVIDGALFKPLPFPRPDELVAVGSRRAENPERPGPLSVDSIESLSNTELTPLAYYIRDLRVGGEDQGPDDRAGLAAVSPSFFDVLEVGARLGRVLTAADSGEDSPRALVLSHNEWRSHFGADENIVGRVIEWRGADFLVLGIAKDGFDFPAGAGGWTAIAQPRDEFRRRFANLESVARVPVERRAATAQRFPGVTVQPLRDYVRPGGTTGLTLLLLATMLVLVVAWIQVAALQLSNADEIRHEMRLRLALGARWRHLVAQRAAEGVWLVLGAWCLAWLVLPAATALVVSHLPGAMTRGLPIETDARVFVFGLCMTLLGVAALVAVPLWENRRASALGVLRGARGIGAGQRVRHALILIQVAVTAALLYVAALGTRSYAELRKVEVGFSTTELVALPFPPAPTMQDPERLLQQRRAQVASVRELPGVASASAASALPFGGQTRSALSLNPTRSREAVPVSQIIVEPDYFSTLEIPVVEGRPFTRADSRDQALVAIVNERASKDMAAQGLSVGSTVHLNGLPTRVVGVAGDTRDLHPALPAEPRVYLPAAQWIPPGYLLIRLTPGKTATTLDLLQLHLRQSFPDAAPPRARVIRIDERLQGTLVDHRGRMSILALAAAIAVGMTFLGIWGSVSASTQSRATEIAIRVVCGGVPARISAGVVAVALAWVCAGLLCGLALAAAASRSIASLFFGVTAVDLPSAAIVAIALLAVAILSSAVPAIRAARLEPWRVLREG